MVSCGDDASAAGNYVMHRAENPVTSEFARGFFLYLQEVGVGAAILHGGEGGFNHDISDVDFVVGSKGFSSLPTVVHDYCRISGWRLCQALQHETTATYFVCCRSDAPLMSVALDACSDYQANGLTLITSEDLMTDPRRLAWGGHAVSLYNQLCYRFAKAAAKGKCGEASTNEFLAYPSDVRRACESWLSERWKITLKSWDCAHVGVALSALRHRCPNRPRVWQAGSPARMAARVSQPSGLVLVVGEESFEEACAVLEHSFAKLGFRRFMAATVWRFGLLKHLISSAIVVVPKLGSGSGRLVPSDCILNLEAEGDPHHSTELIVDFLGRRCRRRLGLNG